MTQDQNPDWLRAILREQRYTNFLLFILVAIALLACLVTFWPR